MQYLLTKEEYLNLVPKKEIETRDAALAAALKIILKTLRPPCTKNFGYCTQCPIDKEGPDDWYDDNGQPKNDDEYKDIRPNDKESELICRKNRTYPK